MKIYTAENIHTFFSESNDPKGKYLSKLVADGLSKYFENIKGELILAKLDDHLLPILVADGSYSNSYVCSPYTHYISVGIESLHTIKNRMFRYSAAAGLRTLGTLLRAASINRTLYVNHWLLSTDLQPSDLSPDQLKRLTLNLKAHYPQHAILFRSLNSSTNSHLMRRLNTQTYQFVASRHVYLTSMARKEAFNNRIVKSDLKLWEEAGCEVVDSSRITDDDFHRISQLCRILAIDHHSTWNPAIKVDFIKLLKDHPAIKLKGIKKNGALIGILGYQTDKDGVITATLFGYDKNHPDQNHHYRLLSTLLLLEADKQSETFHQSAGGSYFKQSRGAQGFTEYQAVYTNHLSLRQKAGWALLKRVINRFAPAIMKEY